MPVVEWDSIFQTVLTGIFSKWEISFPVSVLMGGLVWIWARTGSIHVLATRLWRVVLGKRGIKSSVVSGYLDERDALMHFRLVTGMRRVPTIGVAEKLVEWMQRNDVDVDRLVVAGHYFDVEELKFKGVPLGKWRKLALIIALSVFPYLAVALGALGYVTPSIIGPKKSDVWYKVAPDWAQKWSGFSTNKHPVFDLKGCSDQSSVVAATDYPRSHVAMLCEVMTTEEGKRFLEKTVRGQRALAGFMVCALLILSYLVFAVVRQVYCAEQLLGRINKKPDSVRGAGS